jgi:hypothetical protein
MGGSLATAFSAYCSLRYGITWNCTLLVSVPLGVVTVTYPVVAPAGTVATIKVSDLMVKLAEVPLRETLVVPVNPCPRRPKRWPTLPAPRTNATKGQDRHPR